MSRTRELAGLGATAELPAEHLLYSWQAASPRRVLGPQDGDIAGVSGRVRLSAVVAMRRQGADVHELQQPHALVAVRAKRKRGRLT